MAINLFSNLCYPNKLSCIKIFLHLFFFLYSIFIAQKDTIAIQKLLAEAETFEQSEPQKALQIYRKTQRYEIPDTYCRFLMSNFVLGGGGTYEILKDTDPTVAHIEAFDHFAHRFDAFNRLNPTLRTNMKKWFYFIRINFKMIDFRLMEQIYLVLDH